MGGDLQIIREGGNNSGSYTPTAMLYIPDVFHPKEGWHNETNNRSQRTEQVHSLGTLQDGGNPSNPDAAQRGRLDGETKPEGCILRGPNLPNRQEAPHISIPGHHLPVRVPSIWPLVSPEDLYENNEACHSMVETDGLSDGQLYRRQPHSGSVQARSQVMGRVSSSTLGGPVILGQLREVQPRTISGDPVSGVHGQYQNDDHQCTGRQAGRDMSLSDTPEAKEHSVGKVSGDLYWHGHFHEAGDSTSLTVLLGAPGSQELNRPTVSKHRQSGSAGPRPVGGASLEDRAGPAVEWLLPETTQTSSDDPDGCVQDRLGYSVSKEIHWWPMVPTGDPISHQLPGVASGLPGSPDICQGSERDNSLGSNRRHPDHDIHQSEGWNTFTTVDAASKDNLGLVYGEEDTPPGSRQCQYLCRQGISSDDRLVGLEAPPTDIQQAQQPAGPISGRPVCLQSVNPAKEVLQLETGPSGRGDRCLPPGLDRVGICQIHLGH